MSLLMPPPPGTVLSDIVLFVILPWPLLAMAPAKLALRANVLLSIVILPPALSSPPAPGAVLLVNALLSIVTMPPSLYMPPALRAGAEFLVTVLLIMTTVPVGSLKIPPPKPPLLSEIMLLVTVNSPELKMPRSPPRTVSRSSISVPTNAT